MVSVMRYEPRDFDGRTIDFWNQDMLAVVGTGAEFGSLVGEGCGM
jgi:hypothetical protein